MKKLLLILLLICSSALAQIGEEFTTNSTGQPFIRIYNATEYYVSCYYRDEVNYTTFSLAPYSMSGWQPVYGSYEWECN